MTGRARADRRSRPTRAMWARFVWTRFVWTRSVWTRVSLLTGVCAMALGACGIPVDESFAPLAPNQVPADLAEATTTSSSSTSTPSSTAVLPTTTVPTETVALYFAQGDFLVPIERSLPAPATLDDVLGALSVGPRVDEGILLRGALGVGMVGRTTEVKGVANVALTTKLIELATQEQALAVGQIVLTLTKRAGIGQVTFTFDGSPINVLRPDGSLISGLVTKDAYETVVSLPQQGQLDPGVPAVAPPLVPGQTSAPASSTSSAPTSTIEATSPRRSAG